MTQWNRWRAVTGALILSLVLAGPAAGATFDGLVESKVESTQTLNMEDGVRVKIQSSTQIVDSKGNRASFDDIPDPNVDRLTAMLKVEGQKVTGVLRASKITILELIHE